MGEEWVKNCGIDTIARALADTLRQFNLPDSHSDAMRCRDWVPGTAVTCLQKATQLVA